MPIPRSKTRSLPSRVDLKKKFYKLAVAQSDIAAAYSACELFIERVDSMSHPLYYPLLVTIVVSYARPFIDNRGFGVLPKQWRDFQNPKYQSAHDLIIKARNEVFAHRDTKVAKVVIVPPGVAFGGDNPSSKVGFGIKSYWFKPSQVPLFRDTCADLGKRLLAAIEDLLEVLYGGMELPNARFPLRFDNGL